MKRANTEIIRRAINTFDWVRALSYVNVDVKKNLLFHQDVVQHNPKFDTHETIIIDKRDPSWINKDIKMLMVENNLACK